MKVTEAALPEQSLSLSPTCLQETIEEEGEDDADELQAIKDEVGQLPDLDTDMKSEVEEEQEEENNPLTTGDIEEEEISEIPVVPKAISRGGGRGRNSGRARRSRGKRS